MKKPISLVAGAALAAAIAGSASAGVLYQSTPSLNGGGTYWCSDCFGGTGYQALDPFTLRSSASITGVDVVTFNDSGFDGLVPFTVDVYSSNDPSALVFSQSVTTTLVSSGSDVNGFSYDVVHADLSGLSLAGGQQYWISFNAPFLAIGDSPGNNNGAVQWSPPGSGTSVSLGDNLEYALYGGVAGGVPEPATWAMLILGMAMIGFAVRRRSETGAVAA